MFLKENAHKYYGSTTVKPDIIVKMDHKTFNDISEKKLGGAKAFITGRLKL